MLENINKTYFSSKEVSIGIFDCPIHCRQFNDSSPTTAHMISFPKQAIEVSLDGQRSRVADVTHILLSNTGQTFQRKEVSDYGAYCHWLSFSEELLLQALESHNLLHDQAETRPFQVEQIACDQQAFYQQRLIACQLINHAHIDADATREAVYNLLQSTLEKLSAKSCTPSTQKPNTQHRRRRLARNCTRLIVENIDTKLSLEYMARELATSPYHLCRVFSEYTGQTISAHITALRLRTALDRILDQPKDRLLDIALDVGFTSPSHFTYSFRQHFGCSPFQLKRLRRTLLARTKS